MPDYELGSRSRRSLTDVHPRLIEVVESAIKLTDFTVIEGARSIERQRLYVRTGVSLTLDSRHLDRPARAVDLIPRWPEQPHYRWPDHKFAEFKTTLDTGPQETIAWRARQYGEIQQQWGYTAGILRGIAHVMGIPLTWGGDWNSDGFVLDNRFDDLGHIELPRDW